MLQAINYHMSQASHITSNALALSAHERLAAYVLPSKTKPGKIVALTPDASTREYFRLPWKRGTAIAAVYPEAFDPEIHPFLDITKLFTEAALPVPEIYAVDGASGIIVQEDLGDRQLRAVYESASEDEYETRQEQAIGLIAKIQAATKLAYERHSISSHLAFDDAKLSWELNFFFEHFFRNLRQETLSHAEAAEIKAELNDIAAELSARPRVLCHRDYHTSNLMIDKSNKLAEVRAQRLFFLEERRREGLDALDPDDFAREFRLMTIQRGLKAVGTFSYQTAVRGRGGFYAQYIRPTLLIVLQSAEWLDRFPALRGAISSRLDDLPYN